MSTATEKSTVALNSAQRAWLKKMGAALQVSVADGNGAAGQVTGAKSTGAVSDSGKPGIEPLEAALEFGPHIIDLLKTLGARRACVVKVVNKTSRVLRRGKEKFKSGNFSELPDDEIKPNGGHIEFVAASPENNPIGEVEGEMPWMLDLDTNWNIRFKNPRAGSTEGSTDVTGLNEKKFLPPDMVKGNGDKAQFRFTLLEVGGGGGGGGETPPGPKPAPAVDIGSSCRITVKNQTQVVLTRGDMDHDRGNFMTPPPASIAPGANGDFISVETPLNKDAKDEGCKGFVVWQVGSPPVATWRIEWDNPEGEKNTTKATLEPQTAGFSSSDFILQGDENVPVEFTLSGGGGGGVQPPVSTSKLTVTVQEAATKKPIEGAAVEVKGTSAKTSAAGKADFSLPPGSHPFKATANGFNEKSGTTEIVSGKDNQLTVELEPATKTGKLLVTVMDFFTQKPIEGATVEIASQSSKTDKSGQTRLTLPAGSHPFRATADGFEEIKGNAGVDEGKDNNLIVMMKKPDSAPEFKPPPESKQPTLRKGDKSADGWVEYLQQLLNGHGAKLEVNGDFNQTTLDAVKKFQEEQKKKDPKFMVDGIVGNQTWAALRGQTPEAPSTDGRKPHTHVEQGAEARWWHEGQGIASYHEDADELNLVAVSVGDTKLQNEQATIRVTPGKGEAKVLAIAVGKPYSELPTGAGHLHAVKVTYFRKTFGAGKHKVEAYLPKELGGDLWSGEIEVKPAPEQPLDGKIIGSAQKARADKRLASLDAESRKRFDKLTEDAKSPQERAYLTKTLASNYSMDEIEAFAKKINGKDEKWLNDNLKLTGDSSGKGIKQQWKHSCNATTVQAIRGQLDPIYALKLHEENKDVSAADDSDGTKINPKLAEEQKKKLESKYKGSASGEHSGTAVDRGASGGSGRWADDLMNDMSEVTGVEYANKKISGAYKVEDAMKDVEAAAAVGHPAPIVIGNGPGQFTHYVLVTGVEAGPPKTWTIHDPWDGITVSRSIDDVKNGKINLAGSNQITALDVASTKK